MHVVEYIKLLFLFYLKTNNIFISKILVLTDSLLVHIIIQF